MKIAVVTSGNRTTEMRYNKGLGYSVYSNEDATVHGTMFIPTRQEANQAFLWQVGYPEWRRAGEEAYKAARDKWVASHSTIASVGAIRSHHRRKA